MVTGDAHAVPQSERAGVPAHIATLLVELLEPRTTDIVCDPFIASGSLLGAAAEYVHARLPHAGAHGELIEYFTQRMFHGFARDAAALAAARAALAACGVDALDLRSGDALHADHADERNAYTLVVCAVPAGSTDPALPVAPDLRRVAKTRRRELLALVLCVALLKPGGRAAVLVPDTVLAGATKAHIDVRRLLIEGHKLEAVIRLPAHAVSCYPRAAGAILLLSERSAADAITFFEIAADGFRADRKRRPLLAADKLGPVPDAALSADEQRLNELPAVLATWRARATAHATSADSACATPVLRSELADANFNLDRRPEPRVDAALERAPHAILAELAGLEAEIFQGIRDIVGRLK